MSNKVSHLHTEAPLSPYADAVKMLTELLAKAVSGELRSVCVAGTLIGSEILHALCLEDMSDIPPLFFAVDILKDDLKDEARECETCGHGERN